jgi:hypothetical protein
MKKLIDPAQFGLYPKTVIEELSKNHFALVITRKSRIIMSDGNRILEKAGRIKKIRKTVKVSLKISGPICSKTKKFLHDHGVEIIT